MIRAYVGRLGSGKTLSLIKDSIDYLNDGIKVYTNIPFVNPPILRLFHKPKPSKQPVILNTKQLEDALLTETNCLFAVDEANIVFPAHYWKNLGADFEIMFAMSRKLGVDIYYTSQKFTHTASRLRDLTQEIMKCEKHRFFNNYFFINTLYDEECYKPIYTNELEKKLATLSTRKIFWNEAKRLYKLYDTNKLIEISTAYVKKHDVHTQTSFTGSKTIASVTSILK